MQSVTFAYLHFVYHSLNFLPWPPGTLSHDSTAVCFSRLLLMLKTVMLKQLCWNVCSVLPTYFCNYHPVRAFFTWLLDYHNGLLGLPSLFLILYLLKSAQSFFCALSSLSPQCSCLHTHVTYYACLKIISSRRIEVG